jgi:putative flippase GtrA
LNILRQFAVFTGVGAIGTAFHYLVLVIAVDVMGVDAVISSALGFLVGAVTNYLLNYKLTFRSGKSHGEAATKFAIVAAVGLGLYTSVMAIFVDWMHLHYLLSQILATGLVLLWNFVANRQWTFSDQSDEGL